MNKFTKFNKSEIPVVVYKTIDQIVNRVNWENEVDRITQLKPHLLQIENLLANSKYLELLNAVSKQSRKEIAIDITNRIRLINVVINDVNSPSIFRYSLMRVWYYLINNLQFIVDFMTLDYENVTRDFRNFNSENCSEMHCLLYNHSEVQTPYISYIKVNNKVYRLTTDELFILSIIRLTQMWKTKVSNDNVIVLSTHGIKEYSYPKIDMWMMKHIKKCEFPQNMEYRRSLNDGIIIVKGSYFMNKIELTQSLISTIRDNNKMISEVIISNEFVRMMIQESTNMSAQSKIESMISIISSIMKQSYSKLIDINELMSIAIIHENPTQFLNDILIAYKSSKLIGICESLEIPFQMANNMESIGIIPRVIDVVMHYTLNNFGDMKEFEIRSIPLNLYLKLMFVTKLENCHLEISKNVVIKSKWKTDIPKGVVGIIIDFAYEKFIEPQFNGTFEYDLNKFELVTHFN